QRRQHGLDGEIGAQTGLPSNLGRNGRSRFPLDGIAAEPSTPKFGRIVTPRGQGSNTLNERTRTSSTSLKRRRRDLRWRFRLVLHYRERSFSQSHPPSPPRRSLSWRLISLTYD